MIGETISHYRIVEKLGGGGMGVVYKALDLRLNRFVALKFLPPELTQDSDANQRFRQEAQAASALDHPNICTIHEIGETPDHELFLSLAFYDGETLKRRIERGPLAIDAALDIARQIALGLSRAHQSGIVHRDIKPANVMITAEGLVKIVDFGIAKLTGGDANTNTDADTARTGPTRTGSTRTGTTLGTVAYMSPEQARGGHVDGGTDVWALGVVLYEMLAGVRPFTGKDDVALLSSILTDTPTPIGKVRDGVPAALQRVVARALERNPAARYRTAAEMLADLTSCRDAMVQLPARGSDLLRLLRRPAVAVATIAVLVAASVSITIAVRRSGRVRWAREEAIPQIMRLIQADDYGGAFALATEAELVLKDDPLLARLWPQFSLPGSIVSVPDGADVFVQPYTASDEPWKPLGRTPIKQVRLPRGVFRFRIEKDGFEPRLLAARNPGSLLGNQTTTASIAAQSPAQVEVALVRKGDPATSMVAIPGGAFPVGLTGFNSDQRVDVPPFLMDRYEVTNKEFKRFIDGGGYKAPEHWNTMVPVKDGREIAWQDAVRGFVDSTDRPGPAVWELGEYPNGQDDYPVAGVSWYEALAYCRAAGKTLPTIFDWGRAALSPAEIGSPLAPAIIPLSNFAGKGLAAVGSYRGLGPYGTYRHGRQCPRVGMERGCGRPPVGPRWKLGRTGLHVHRAEQPSAA